MSKFIQQVKPTKESHWRSIILFGRNVATFKFALGETLLHFARSNKQIVTMEELAIPYAQSIARHIAEQPKQGIAKTSEFLEACSKYSRQEITIEQLQQYTVRLGFNNVIDAFHILPGGLAPTRFFIDERNLKRIVLTDELLSLAKQTTSTNLPFEVEARWRLVENAWALGINRALVTVQYNQANESFHFLQNNIRRTAVVSARDSLSGYQNGKCFYCFRPISLDSTLLGSQPSSEFPDVDHCFPHRLKQYLPDVAIDGVWNLVLACKTCNRGVSGKFDLIPHSTLIDRLHKRNNFLIDSHHPLRETLMTQTGLTEELRLQYLQQVFTNASTYIIHTWTPKEVFDVSF